MRETKVAVIGGGSMGRALALAATAAGCEATLCFPDPAITGVDERTRSFPGALGEIARVSAVMDEVVAGAVLVIMAVPSPHFRAAARSLAAHGIAGRPILSSTKGFEPVTHARMSEILAEETGSAALGAIAGANITPELVAGRLGGIVVASAAPEIGAIAKRCLESAQLRVWLDPDIVSIELAAALKNVVAIGVAIATGLELGFNAQSIVFGCGLREIAALGSALGADAGAFAGLAGAGDLFLTASSPDALNRRLGIELGRGACLADVLAGLPEIPEGIGSARACRALARRHGLRLPIAEAVAAILDGERQAAALADACREAGPA